MFTTKTRGYVDLSDLLLKFRDQITRQRGYQICVGVIAIWWLSKLIKIDKVQTTVSLYDLLWSTVFQSTLVLAVIFFLAWICKDSLSHFGIASQNLFRQLMVGLAFSLIIFIVSNISGSIVKSLVHTLPEGKSDISNLFQNFRELPIWLFVAVYGGGIVEEVERIFVLTRFEFLLKKIGLVLGLGLSTLFFSLGHLYQGVSGAVSAGVSGLCFGFVYLRRKRALEAISAHSFYDIIGIAAAYAIYAK